MESWKSGWMEWINYTNSPFILVSIYPTKIEIGYEKLGSWKVERME